MSQELSAHSRVVKAADIAMSPQQVNFLANKVIHTQADFRVESIEDVTPALEQIAAPETQLQPTLVDPNDDGDKKQAALMRMWWDEAMARHMVLSEGYSHVAVLIIRWADYLDDLKTKKEVRVLLRGSADADVPRRKNSSKSSATAFDTTRRRWSST